MLPSTSAPSHDNVNLQEERPMVVFGPLVEEKDPFIAPLYVTLVIHDLLLHNYMLDSCASHNVVVLIVMEKLGLEITKPYKDLYSFDFKIIKCLGMIKDLVVNLAQILVKSVVMDIVVDNIPTNIVQILGFEDWRFHIVGSDLCHHLYLWWGKKEDCIENPGSLKQLPKLRA